MEPTRDSHATLVDLLDRVLDKGLVVYADIIISVAGVPLIGVNLRAALAGMETMLQYGLMQEWDERIRAWEREQRGEKATPMASGDGDRSVQASVLPSHAFLHSSLPWREGARGRGNSPSPFPSPFEGEGDAV